MAHIGVSGWSFPEWKDTFYAGVAKSRWLEYYSTVLSTVEVNYTFRRTMAESTALKWREAVTAGFRFAVKAHQRITHLTRLADPEGTIPHFVDACTNLGDALGPILFQLPPSFKRDDERLERFLAGLPSDISPAFEFRHPSWSAEPVHRLLENAGAAWVIAETDDNEPARVVTAPFTYLRLRKTEYSPAALRTWAATIRSNGVESWVYFKHETTSTDYAQRLVSLLSGE
ncbi:MAG: DUF72 domain-containing protein [Acidimicrobiia bacterium]